MTTPEDGIQNPAVRAAVEAFAAAPDQSASIDVLRACLHGALLLDGTGSELSFVDGEPGTMAPGSMMRIATATGPDGATALLAFTSQQEIVRVHDEGTEVISFGQPAVGVLELVKAQEHGWLYLDPAGPTCALSAREIEFALAVPRNDAVRDALEPGVDRAHLLAALRAEGQLLLAAEADEALADGVVEQDTEVRLRVTSAPDGGSALTVFTSGPEVVARNLRDRIIARPSAEVLDIAREGGFDGIVINPAGPWAYVPVAEF